MNKTDVSRLQWPQAHETEEAEMGGSSGYCQSVFCQSHSPKTHAGCSAAIFAIIPLKYYLIKSKLHCWPFALAFPWGWSAASWQAGCRRLGDRSAWLNRLHLPLHSLPTKGKCSRAWLSPCPLGGLCVSPVSAQKIWQWLLRRWGYIPEALIEVSEIVGERSMKRGVRSPMWMCGAVSFLLTGFLTERWWHESGVFSYLA